ncbi:MAG: VWA domain-containing protein [Anaerolineales bacterium]|nr:VWA domain-containing protein [Anaerolineales bacterium]
MSFSSPLFLLLLLTLPLIGWLGWPSRGYGRRREIVSLGLRLLLALLLILGLTGLEVRQPSNALSVVFLVDSSDSMTVPMRVGDIETTPRQLALEYVRRALREMGPDDKAGIILFGGDAVVERALSTSRQLETPTSVVTSLQTDIAGAIRLGLALLPTNTARRLVILSDGLETTGDALEAARLAAATGTQIVVVPFSVSGGAEALITSVKAPTRLRQGEQFALEVRIDSTVNQRVGVRVLAGADVAYEGQLELRRGSNAFSLPLKAGAPGFSAYRVQIVPNNRADTFYQNNELAAFSQIEGPARLLLVTNPKPRDGVPGYEELLRALQGAGLQVEVTEPGGLPSELPALAEYASVILVDVPARQLSQRQMTALETYVRDLGGGLVAVGGPTSFGVGGYFKTPLERALPVDMEIKDEKRRARLTLVFIIDKSGSMSEISGGVQKMELAKEAAARSIELLSPSDKVGVIAFDDTAAWVVPITPLDNPDAVINQIGTIRADGGTDIMAGVRLASQSLPQDDSAVKHIILLTDGIADPTGIPELVRKMNQEDGITLSSVAVGQGAAPFLADLAREGGGLYHFTDDPASIPRIFAEEVTMATRSYIIEQEFFPRQASPSPILQGIESAPKLLGYVGATAKSAAQVILVNPDSPDPQNPDPILAAWQYGLGKSVAWTSDATGRWAQNWVGWEQFARFWAQTVRYTVGEGAQSSTDVRIQRQGETATITVDARSEQGAFLNGLNVQANVIGPDGTTQVLTLTQSAPGRYIGSFNPTEEGAYLIRVAGSEAGAEGDSASIGQTTGWVLSYSPEYQIALPSEETQNLDPPNVRFLLQLAQVTGGGSVVGEYARVFANDLPPPPGSAQPLWPWLLLAAVLLLPFDIAVRRLVLSRYEMQRAWARVLAFLAIHAPQPKPPSPQRAEQLSSLFKAKERAGEAAPRAAEPPPIITSSPPSVAPPAPPSPAAAPRPAVPPQTAAPTSASSATSTTAALLAKKKARSERGSSKS